MRVTAADQLRPGDTLDNGLVVRNIVTTRPLLPGGEPSVSVKFTNGSIGTYPAKALIELRRTTLIAPPTMLPLEIHGSLTLRVAEAGQLHFGCGRRGTACSNTPAFAVYDANGVDVFFCALHAVEAGWLNHRSGLTPPAAVEFVNEVAATNREGENGWLPTPDELASALHGVIDRARALVDSPSMAAEVTR